MCCVATALALAGGNVSAGVRDAPAPSAQATPLHATIHTDHGDFDVELYPHLAPETVRLFVARARAAETRGTAERGTTDGAAADRVPAAGAAVQGSALENVAPYAGTQLCESRGSAFLVFGCLPFENSGPKPRAARVGPRPPDEIDGRAMGLGAQPLGTPQESRDVWQLEILPRYAELRQKGQPVPPGLEALVEDAKARGTAAVDGTAGKSRLWYLEAVGFAFTPGASPLRVTRGALASFTLWPGEADERFLVALDDLPPRDGRATVFGRVVAGWETLDRLQQIPVDKARRPLEPVRITGIDVVDTDPVPEAP